MLSEKKRRRAGFPAWASFTPEKTMKELPALLAKSERAVTALENSSPRTFEDLVWKLDDAVREAFEMWSMANHMHSVMNSDGWRKAVETLQPQVVALSLRIGQSKKLYEAAKKTLENVRRLPASAERAMRERILENTVKSAEHSGVSLEGEKKKRFAEIEEQLAKLGSDFSNAVVDATKAFSFEKNGKTYTIDDASYFETMKHCADREVREKLCRARSSRAPSNTARISQILSLRREQAALLGFGNYAELSLDSKSAPSCEAVMKMIDDLDEATREAARREDAEIGADAAAAWDVAYLAERLREKKYSYSEEELKKHFEFSDVLAGLFRMTKFLFGADVEEADAADMPETWHEDVRFFRVSRGGRVVAHFYLDPYVRNGLKRGGAWMNEFANRSDRRGVKPLAVLVLNLPAPDADGRCFLPLMEVETVFHEFGHALQCMLTEVGEEDAAGINLVEWDAVEVASQFMEYWCLDARTGISMPPDLKEKVVAAKNFRAASMCRRQLAFAKIDMLLHMGGATSSPDGLKKEVFGHFGLKSVEEDVFLNSFSHIFAGGYAAGYYGYKWSEVMSADAYGAFEEAGLSDDEAVKRTGERYARTILALGGSVSAYESFRRFRGREPEIGALLRQRGLAK
ncbi:MAG: M3 family metallopeptidase [Kiritimatiellae bacterium]|nr:M3 family metallopeptidase [Kiritimatiellia bacterium]